MIRVLEVLTFGLNTGYVFVFFCILKMFLTLRKNWLVKIAAFIAFHFIADAIIYSNDLDCLLLSLAGFFFYLTVFYRGALMEKLSVLLVFYPSLISINYLMLDIGSRIFFAMTRDVPAELRYSPDRMLLDTGLHAFSLFLRLLFWIGAWMVLRKFISNIANHLTMRMWLIIDMLMLASFVAVFTIIYFMPRDTLIVYPICCASIFSSFGCMYLASYICEATQNAYRVQALERQSSYYKDRIQDEERVRSIYHDFKNHLLILQSETQDEKTAMQSIRSLQEQIEGYENYYHTGNEVLDIILRDKAKRAQERHIDFCAALSFADGGFIESLDISTIFGNALDNAIEASEKLPEERRLITARAGRVRDMLFILVENNAFFSGDASGSASGKTTKEDVFLHGFGLANIKKAVERYDGQCSIKKKEDAFVLKIVIPIP